MNHSNGKQSKIDDMLFLLVEGALDREGIDYVKKWLSSGPQAKRYYCEFINDYVAMNHQVNALIDMNEETVSVSSEFDMELWSALSDAERTAPSVKIPDVSSKVPQRELIQKVVYQKVPYKVNKFSIYTVIFSAAAMILFMLFVKYAPPRIRSVEIAQIVDQMNVQWGKSAATLQTGSHLMDDQGALQLEAGIVKICYEQGVDMVVEGPAVFEVNPQGVFLDHGQLFCDVSGGGIGFIVQTRNSEIVDLGTKFGVYADLNGGSEVYVVKGKVQLNTGSSVEPVTQILKTRQAAVVSTSRQVREVPYQQKKFVQNINSVEQVVWKGDSGFSLADVVAGGDGFSRTVSSRGFKPDTGQLRNKANKFNVYKASGRHGKVRNAGCIDSTFVPNDVAIQISSKNHKCNEFYDTTTEFWSDITTDVWIPKRLVKEPESSMITPNGALPIMNGVTYGGSHVPAIFISPNSGITFDLQKIRANTPGQKIVSFKTVCGVPENTVPTNQRIMFWVLFDGKKEVTFETRPKGECVKEIQIPVPDSVQYISLAATIKGQMTKNCWSLFGDPRLELQNE